MNPGGMLPREKQPTINRVEQPRVNFAVNAERAPDLRQVNSADNRQPIENLQQQARAAAITLQPYGGIQLVAVEAILEGGPESQLGAYYAKLTPAAQQKFRQQGEALGTLITGELQRELSKPERRGLASLLHEALTAIIPNRDVRFWTRNQVEGWLTRNGVSRAFAEQHAEIALQKFVTLLKEEREQNILSH